MSTISKSLSGFIFNGASLTLASAPFKGNLNTVYGFNSAGNGYTSFKPGNAFNSLTQLSQNGVYIVDAKSTGFDIPGAMVTANMPAVAPLIGIVSAVFTKVSATLLRAQFLFNAPTPTCNVAISSGVAGGDFGESYSNVLTSGIEHTVDFRYSDTGEYIIQLSVTTPEEDGKTEREINQATYTQRLEVGPSVNGAS